MSSSPQKVYWITGASSGIGAALAENLAARGFGLVLSARRKPALENAAERCRRWHSHVQVLVADHGELENTPRVVEQALGAFGRLDGVILNAGISQRSTVLNTELEVYERIMRVNYLANVAITQDLLPYFCHQNRGHIVVVSSLVGKFGSPLRSGYAASKHALHGFYDSLRAELVDTHIDVTLVCPGFVRTQVSFNALAADGSPHGVLDQALAEGMDSGRCAEAISKALDTRPSELVIAGREGVGVVVKRFFPALFEKLIARMKVT